MEIKKEEKFDFEALKQLYSDAGWYVYLKDDTRFQAMFDNAYVVYGAYQNDKLVGVIRGVSDSVHILYIQDIIVLSNYRKQGIGSALLKTMVNNHRAIRQKVLITDAFNEGANAFYEACGFKKSHENKINCYIRFDIA